MSENNKINQKGRYDMLQNTAGEILIIIEYCEGGPENPRILYDGGDTALLYRSRESAFVLNDIAEEAHAPLKSVSEVLVAEIENDDVAREYKVPMRIIRSIKDLG
ncbi:MAG: hypothetical protein J6Y53_03935 [Alphaproteobacteria bacterium]|nr:hypothetical protein [Alphaproteobacteria bacterium]